MLPIPYSLLPTPPNSQTPASWKIEAGVGSQKLCFLLYQYGGSAPVRPAFDLKIEICFPQIDGKTEGFGFDR